MFHRAPGGRDSGKVAVFWQPMCYNDKPTRGALMNS